MFNTINDTNFVLGKSLKEKLTSLLNCSNVIVIKAFGEFLKQSNVVKAIVRFLVVSYTPNHSHSFFRMFSYIYVYVVNTVFYVINVALPLTQCIGYNCAIKYSSFSSSSV